MSQALLGRDLMLAPDVEHRTFGDLVVLRAHDGMGHVAVTPTEADALLGRSGPVPADTDLTAALHDQGLLVGAARPVRRPVTVTADGVEFDVLARPLRAIATRFDPVLRSRTGQALIAGMAIVGLAGLVASALPSPPDTSPRAAALAVVVLQVVSGLLHEISHAMVIALHGRRVGRLGIGLYWGAPSIYVDSTEAMFLERKARIAQACAGVLGELVIAGPLLLASLMLAGTLPGVGRAFALVTITNAMINLAPMLKLDGYWAFADILDRPRLAEQSWQALCDTVRRRPADPRLAGYAAVGLVFGTILLAGSLVTWWSLRGPIISDLWTGALLDRAAATALALPLLASILGGILALVVGRRHHHRT